MKPLGIVYGALAGAVGAAIWFAIAHYANREVGYVAWGIGALVGFAVAYGNGEGGPIAGVGAALITIVALLVGKYAVVEVQVQQFLADAEPQFSETDFISYVADDVVAEFEAAGKPVNWPAGVDPEDAWEPTDYPSDVWKLAEAKWQQLPAEEQEAFRQEVREDVEAGRAQFMNEVRQSGFLATFGLFDIVFFGLGIATAFGIANNADEA